MKFVADEGTDAAIVHLPRKNGYDVFYIAESNPSIPDSEVLKISVLQEATLITQDKDFGELVYRLKQVHHGIILVRLHGKKPKVKAQIILDALKKYSNDLKLAFTVIHEDFIKIRK